MCFHVQAFLTDLSCLETVASERRRYHLETRKEMAVQERLLQVQLESIDRMAEQLLNAKELAARLGVALLTVYRMAEQGRIPSVPIGRMLRFDFDAVLKHLGSSEAAKRDKLCLRERGAERRPKMAKTQHFSRGYVRLRNDVVKPYYEGQYRIYRSGQKPERKSINLGYESEIKAKEARLRLQELLGKQQRNVQQDCESVTLNDYLQTHYLRSFLPKLKPSTRKSYAQIIDKHIKPTFGAWALSAVKRKHVQDFIDQLAGERSRQSLENIRNVLRSIFREAIRDEQAGQNPGQLIKMPPREARERRQLPTRETLKKLLELLDEPYRTLAFMALVSGCRIGELCALKWKEIDLNNKVIYIRLALYNYQEHEPKGHRQRHPIPLTDAELQWLKNYRARTPEATGEDWVFSLPAWNGRRTPRPDLQVNGKYPLDEQHALRCGLAKVDTQVGCKLGWHLLRHWAGTFWYYEGVPLKVIQARLGHADVRTTMTWYIECVPAEELRGAETASHLVQQLLMPSVPGGENSGIVVAGVAVNVDSGQQMRISY
jgi:excisionase family DNA binding protein